MMMVKMLRFKPSLLFSGRRSSISEAALIQSKLQSGASSIRCYATFNFVADSSSVKRITHQDPPEKFHSETPFGRQSPAVSRHGVEVLQNFMCSVQNSSDNDDDDFAELGSPMPQMQKPTANGEPYKKLMFNETEKASKLAFVASLDGKVKKTPQKQNIHQPAFRFKLKDHYVVARTKPESEIPKHVANNSPSHRNSNCVTIEKVPSSISISELRQAMSVYGKVSNAFMKCGQNGFRNFHIEFKTAESLERALLAKRVTVRNVHLEIRRLPDPEIFTIRISNISMDTVVPTIHSICMSCGSMEGLWKTKEGHVDVLFSIKDHLAVQTVLKKLNDVKINGCQWSAQLLSKNAPDSVNNGSDAKLDIGSQISDLIISLKEQLQMKRIYMEDLENLHYAIVHLEECPSISHQ